MQIRLAESRCDCTWVPSSVGATIFVSDAGVSLLEVYGQHHSSSKLGQSKIVTVLEQYYVAIIVIEN